MVLDIALLIFSRNDTGGVKDIIFELYDTMTEIIVVDSSDEEEYAEFLQWTRKYSKIKLYYVSPLGYPDMLRPYAFTKCKSDWVLLLDADERPSDSLKRDLHEIIESDSSDVYAIQRFPGTKQGEKIANTRNKQVRLFNKNFIDEKGIMHQLPTSKGRFLILPDKYYILHLIDDKVNRFPEYLKIDRFMRYSYNDLSIKAKKLFNLLGLIRKINFEDELSTFSYFLL